jgi:hypothetical protein
MLLSVLIGVVLVSEGVRRIVSEDGRTVYIHYSPTHGYVVASYGGLNGAEYEWFPPEVIPDLPEKYLDIDRPLSVDE